MSSRTVWTRVGLGVGMAAVAAVTATGAFGGASAPATSAAAAKPTLAVVVVGGGRVTSAPAGISCPGKCSAAFAAGSRVLLTPTPKERLPVPPLGWRLHRRARVQGEGLGPGRRRGAVRRVDGKADTARQASAVEPGGYSGQLAGGNGVTFSVPAGGGSVLNFTVPGSNLGVDCVGGGGSYDTPFKVLKTTIKPDRSFTATASQNGVVNGVNAKVHLLRHRALPGEVRDRSGDCGRSVPRRHRLRRHAQPQVHVEQPTLDGGSISTACEGLRRARHLLGPGQDGISVTFFVPAGAGSVLNFSVPGQATPASTAQVAARTTLRSRSRRRRSSPIARSPPRSLRTAWSTGPMRSSRTPSPGTSRGPNAAGRPTAAGVYREDIVFTDTPNRTCTSNDQPWTAARTG